MLEEMVGKMRNCKEEGVLEDKVGKKKSCKEEGGVRGEGR